MKTVYVSVTNDLSTDQRVAKTCNVLFEMGFDVVLVGRKLKTSRVLENRHYKTRRMNLIFVKGPLFYLEYNIRLLFLLAFNKANMLVSNDLDTLLANFIASRIKRVPLVYDTHEYFTEVPELEGRFAKKVWLTIEGWIFPKLTEVITVNDSIANIYGKKYGKNLLVVRNLPQFDGGNISPKTKAELRIADDCKVVILQGSGINLDRGGEEAVLAMKYIENVVLMVVGGGDAIPKLAEMVEREHLDEKVKFFPRMPISELYRYTKLADIGLSLDKPTNLNYIYSLPNKLFDYINCGVPILASNMVEVAKIIEIEDVGVVIDDVKPELIADRLSYMLAIDFKKLKAGNLVNASKKYSWENEKMVLTNLFSKY